jgi:hypothetical protein
MSPYTHDGFSLGLAEIEADDREQAALADQADRLRVARVVATGAMVSLPMWALIFWIVL